MNKYCQTLQSLAWYVRKHSKLQMRWLMVDVNWGRRKNKLRQENVRSLQLNKLYLVTRVVHRLEVVFPTRVFPNPKPVFLTIFYYPKPGFLQSPNPDIKKKLELLLHSNTSNSDNAEVSDWGVQRAN